MSKRKEMHMKKLELSPPELATIAATRGIAGVGLGLLLSRKLTYPMRRKVGWALFGLGALSTLPIAYRMHSRFAARH